MSDLAHFIADLERGDVAAQARAAEELAHQADQVQAALVALVRRSGSPDEAVANWCHSALEDGGPPADDQIADLISLVDSADEAVAWWAATLLGRARARAKVAAAALQRRQSDPATPVPLRQRIAWAINRIAAAI